MTIRWKKIALALAVIVAGGAARLPVEQRHMESLRAQNLQEQPLGLSLRDDLGQSLFIATLGGFRSPVASIMELRSVTPWMQGDWGVVEECYAICTKLQPREEHYWDSRAWHQACNARDSYLWESTRTKANRELLAQQSVDNGIRILKEGVQRLPESWKLCSQLAWYSCMEENQQPDHAAAAELYAKAATLPGAPGVFRRQAVYQLTHLPEREREAWDKLLAFYHDPDNHLPSVDVGLLYLFFERKIHQRHPDVVLPPDLFRLFVPGTVLSNRDQARRTMLVESLKKRIKPDGIKVRGPQVTSPHFGP